jgi:outer membrane protein assembly factor BamB
MIQSCRKHCVLLLGILLLFMSANGQKNNLSPEWNQWRGADRSGTWYGGPAVEFLTKERIKPVWEADIGSGYSGPTVSGGKVYVMDLQKGSERILCFDAADGSQLWSHAYPVSYSVGYPTGPRASVLVHGGKAYSWGTMGHLFCLDAENGKVVWEVNAVDQYDSRIPIWGLASNPILLNDQLIVQIGGTSGAGIVAFDKDTGRETWRALEDEASYSSPLLINQAGKEVLVFWTGESITGLNPKNGNIYWSLPFVPGKMIINIADPVYQEPYMFLSGFYDGSYLVKINQESLSAELVYHRSGSSEKNTDALHCCISTPIIEEGYIYGIDSYGEARCLNLKTGDRIWEDLSLVPKARWANVHLVRQGDKVWGFNEIGELLLGKFAPSGYRDLGRVKIIDPVRISPNPRNGVTWAFPAFSGPFVFVRNDSKLVCIRISS